MLQRRSPGSEARAPSTTPIAKPDCSASPSSQQVSWWTVHAFVAAVLSQVNDWPLLGTPAWSSLTHDDPRKWAAILDGAQHWALRIETCQEAHTNASRAVSGSVDWSELSREINRRTEFYASRPWLRRQPR
ncbi:DUF2742 domain-containing protein [Mycobacterium shigaense]|uniref:DUF2742 domain-containing protein n=1 Tax=Mycobacterium shigaense TaxID=722731 RepID=UPI002ADFEDCA|nr:DUF2742 domain-containing protein [Mycobacterium shigaense]MEA1123887.1 DUF2742 domain-containing protein [Mycobacterium shigaense]